MLMANYYPPTTPTAADMDVAPVPAGMELLGQTAADRDMAPVPAGMELLGPDGVDILYGADQDYNAIYGVHGHGQMGDPLNAFEINVDMEDKVTLGTTLIGAAAGAAVLALILGGRSRVLAAIGGAAGAAVGGIITNVIGKQVITYKRIVKTAVTPTATITPVITPVITTTPSATPSTIADLTKELEGDY